MSFSKISVSFSIQTNKKRMLKTHLPSYRSSNLWSCTSPARTRSPHSPTLRQRSDESPSFSMRDSSVLLQSPSVSIRNSSFLTQTYHTWSNTEPTFTSHCHKIIIFSMEEPSIPIEEIFTFISNWTGRRKIILFFAALRILVIPIEESFHFVSLLERTRANRDCIPARAQLQKTSWFWKQKNTAIFHCEDASPGRFPTIFHCQESQHFDVKLTSAAAAYPHSPAKS